jgi:hypothetical protein
MSVMPSWRAALRRRWPSITSPSLRARHGTLKPNSRILPHMRSTPASFLRGDIDHLPACNIYARIAALSLACIQSMY